MSQTWITIIVSLVLCFTYPSKTPTHNTLPEVDAALQNKAAALGWTQPEIDAINSRVKLDKIGAVGPYPATWMDVDKNGGKKTTKPRGVVEKKRGCQGCPFLFVGFFWGVNFRVLGGWNDELLAGCISYVYGLWKNDPIQLSLFIKERDEGTGILTDANSLYVLPKAHHADLNN